MSAILKSCNRGGIPCLKSVSTAVVDTTLTVVFPDYSNYPKGYSGAMFINVNQPYPSPTTVTNINLVIQGDTVELMKTATKVADASNIPGPGVYEVFVDDSSRTIQLI